MKLKILFASLLFFACSDIPIKVIPVHDSAVEEIRIASDSQVYSACYESGGHDDQGQEYGYDAEFGGCYDRITHIIWVNRDCDIKDVIRHESCHAYSGLPDSVCDKQNPVRCPDVYFYGLSGDHVNGK